MIKRKSCQLLCLLTAPGVTFAHAGFGPGSALHTMAHLGEWSGLFVTALIAIAFRFVLKRRRTAKKSMS